MVKFDLKNYGFVETGRRRIKCDLTVSAKEFFSAFSDIPISAKAKEDLTVAMNSGEEEKTRETDELEGYFGQIQQRLRRESVATKEPSGGAASEAGGGGAASAEDAEGDKIPVLVQEKIVAKYKYNFLAQKKEEPETRKPEEEEEEESEEEEEEESEEEELEEGYGILTRDGQIIFKNSSSEQRVWDLSGKLVHNGNIEELDEEYYIKELNPEEEHPIEYQIRADKEPSVKLNEFISTINDPNVNTFSLNMGAENVVYFKLQLTNTEDFVIKNIVLTKTLFEGYSNFDVRTTSTGEVNSEENALKWEIPELASNGEAVLEFTLTVTIDNKEDTVRSGEVEIVYDADYSLSDLKIEEFEALGDNMVSTSDEQIDDNPDFYHGFLEYENQSPYIAKLKEVSVKQLEKDDELIELPGEDVFLSAGEGWQSNTWEIDTQAEIPRYQKNVAFILLHNLTSMTSTTVQIEDIELAVAIFDANVAYDVETIQSHREVAFNATHTLTNGGATPFDYISIEQTVPEHFRLPEKEEIKLSVDGKEYDLDPAWISVEGRRLYIEMDGLEDSEIGMFKPDQEMVVIFPIVAENLTPEEEFVSRVEWRANTKPRGEPIVIVEEGEEIKLAVVHERIKIFRGKSVRATAEENIFEVVLKVRNNGNFAVQNYELKDRVPDNFDAEDLSLEATEHSEHDGKEVIVWTLESLEQDEEIEITYTLKPSNEEASASGAQFSM